MCARRSHLLLLIQTFPKLPSTSCLKKARHAALFSCGVYAKKITLQHMNTRPRFSIAILVSLSVHLGLLLWALPQMQQPQPEGQGLLQVFIERHTVSSLSRVAEVKHVNKTADPVPPAQTSGARPSGHFVWQPPPRHDPNEGMNAMQLAQLAQQRESQRYAVSAGLNNLVAQLRSVISGRIVCTQQANSEIECQPEPSESARPLLEQFFYLAAEAHRLGITENPVHMDFGVEQGVSVKLLP